MGAVGAIGGASRTGEVGGMGGAIRTGDGGRGGSWGKRK